MAPPPSLDRLRALGYPIDAHGQVALPPPARLPWEPPPLTDQLGQLRAMTAHQRVTAMYRGELTYTQLCKWAAACPDQVAVVDDEWIFLVGQLADREPAATLAASGRGRA